MENTETQTFRITKKQKETLVILHKKYKINTSEFIRKAIDEKLERDKKQILLDYRFRTLYGDDCPF